MNIGIRQERMPGLFITQPNRFGASYEYFR
jgi:hypothetical protein